MTVPFAQRQRVLNQRRQRRHASGQRHVKLPPVALASAQFLGAHGENLNLVKLQPFH